MTDIFTRGRRRSEFMDFVCGYGVEKHIGKDCIKQTDKTIRLTSATSELDLTVSPSAPKPAVQNGETFTVVEQMPEYPGGMKALMGYLAENIQYPAECQKAGIQGRVIVQFVVKADGSLDNFEIKRSVNPLLDAEALRVIKTTPKWKPGTQHGKPVDVKFTIPVTFSLPDKQKEHTPTGNISDSSLTLKKTLFIIDGKEVEPKALNEINPDQISSINVIKDGTGVTIFGPKARDGVILITTKDLLQLLKASRWLQAVLQTLPETQFREHVLP